MPLHPLIAVTVALAMLVAVAAQPARGNAGKGGQLASQWCVGCHVIGEGATGAVQQGPPSFRTIARGGATADQLRAFLSHPHGAMPDLSLTRAEIDDLIDYIKTRR